MYNMVGVLGFEPRTSSLSGTRSNQLSYTPIFERASRSSDGAYTLGGAKGTRTLDILLAKQML